jgi:hypothetical protein
MSKNSRALFIEKLVKKLTDNSAGTASFRRAFYRSLEVLKLRHNYVDIEQYLQFTAIELLARHTLNATTKNTGEVIYRFLSQLGFETTQREWERWMQYRNALFHQGALEGKFDGDTVGLSDLPLLNFLLSDIIIRLVDFDDGTINWNRWKDRMPWAG